MGVCVPSSQPLLSSSGFQKLHKVVCFEPAFILNLVVVTIKSDFRCCNLVFGCHVSAIS